MEKTRRINKKKLKEVSWILALLIIIIILITSIRKTLSRYQSDISGDVKDLEVAFWIVDNDLQSKSISIENIYPNDNVTFDYDFSVCNYKQVTEMVDDEEVTSVKRAETAIEYDITIKATTNMPLNYALYYGEELCETTEEIKLINGVYYKILTANAVSNSDKLTLGFNSNETKNYTIKVSFPSKIDMMINNTLKSDVLIDESFNDLIDSVKIDISARQKID